MLSFNRKYGLGAALRQRSIWSGSARAAPGMVVQQLNPYRPRVQSSPANVAMEGLLHNGVVYMGKTGNTGIYTTPDLVTLTARVINGATFVIGLVVIGSTFCAVWTGGGQHVLSVSTDNGVTWTGGTNTALTNPKTLSAGGIGYLLVVSSSSSFSTFNAAGTLTVRAFPTTNLWGLVVSTGTSWVAQAGIGGGTPAAAYSVDGQSFTISTSYAAEVAKLPAAPTAIYVLGNRYVVVAFSGATFSTIYSDDGGVTWQRGARYGDLASGRAFAGVNANAVVLDGHLYIAAAAGGAAFILSTADGVTWRTHSDFNATASLPGLYKVNGANAFVFNTGSETAPLMEINTTAQELYYEL